MLRLRSLAQERDSQVMPGWAGSIVIWPTEVRHLVDALAREAAMLAEDAAKETDS